MVVIPGSWSNHKFEAILRCEQYAAYQFLVGEPEAPSYKRQHGVAFHTAIDAYTRKLIAGAAVNEAVDAAIEAARETYVTYLEAEALEPKEGAYKWPQVEKRLKSYFEFAVESDAVWQPIGAELWFEVPLVGGYTFTGRIDGLRRNLLTGDVWLYELKTTGSWGLNELDRLAIDNQLSGYVWAVHKLGFEKIQGVLVDVVVVRVGSVPFVREAMTRHKRHLDLWERQALALVKRWEEEVARDGPIRNTRSCTMWGVRCPYLDACMFGDFYLPKPNVQDSIDNGENYGFEAIPIV